MQIRPVGLLAVRSRSEATWAESLRRVNEKLGDLRVAAHTGSMLRTARSESLIRGVHRAAQNLQDAWNLTATAEGGTRQILDKVQELRSLAIRAAQAMWTEDEWKSMQDQVRQTLWGISEISNGTRYNGIPVLLGDIEGEPTGIPTAEGYGPRGQSVTRSISPTVTPLGASGSRAHSSQSFSVTDPVDLKHTLPRWSADGTLIRATRTLDNESTQTVHYDSAGSVGLSPPGGMTFDAVARTSVTIAGEIWQLSRLSNGINGHADGLYVRKDTEPWTRLLTFPSGNSQFSFSPAGDRIALVRNAGATGATIQIHDFTQGPPPTLRAGHNINLDGDTDGVPQTYGLAGFNLYPLADGSPSIGINVVSQHTGVSRNLAWDSTGTDGYSVDYVAKTITFHSSATLDSNDTLTFTGVTGSNGTDPVTGVPFVEIGLTHAP
ncbi:MAG: hypothetical protein VKO21_04595, partial [Candidatus Sericytochromatia bacterium]|nr:hypothetical protein [Candidatus Sericytochromatia bacterium]